MSSIVDNFGEGAAQCCYRAALCAPSRMNQQQKNFSIVLYLDYLVDMQHHAA
ncbi:hypothetical protein [Microcoleus sp.]|uniref:hypothetical protein n=1 Tax=Microcoleus sp. TaxID=44472 RepID=UPI00403E8582